MVPAALFSCAVTIWLGFWQLGRLEQRRELNFQLGSRVVAEAVRLPGPLSRTPPSGDVLREIEFRPVVLRGFWDFSKERTLPNQFWDRQLGVKLVAPLTLEDGSGAVLVDRGWVPAPAGSIGASELERYRPQQRAALESVEVRGYVRLGGSGVLDTLRRDIERDGTTLLPFTVQEAPPISSIGVNHEQPLPYKRPPVASIGEGVHAIAAAQWFIISGIIVVGMVAYVIQRRRPRSQRDQAETLWPRLARERAAAPGLPKGR
jgi:cytochrome oxidase assembly protein ShyY1